MSSQTRIWSILSGLFILLSLPAQERTEPEFPLQVNFFSEGGDFVYGLENHMIIKSSDSHGRPVSGTGWLVKGSGDTLK